MSDPPEETNCCDADEQRLLRLVPERELDRLRASEEHLAETVDDLEAENRMLRLEVAALERRLEQKDRKHQQIIENYERILAERDHDREAAVDDTEPDRSLLVSTLFGRSDES